MRCDGTFAEVSDERFDALCAALDAVFGEEAPRRGVSSPRAGYALAPRGGSRCGACGERIDGWGVAVSAIGGLSSHGFEVGCVGLDCAHERFSDALREAAKSSAGVDVPAVLGGLWVAALGGSLARCELCRGVIRRTEPRLTRAYTEGSAHVACAAVGATR